MSQAIIITGMHRSGTSLVSSLLQRGGINIGEQLLAANSANPRGYFEDVGFYEFHEHLLHERGQTYLHVDPSFAFEPTEPEISRAQGLIAERAQQPLWGWKDPRTSLFLDFWNQLLPEGRFLFVYRHPLEVLLSLLRRGEFDNHPSLLSGLNAWHVYNSRIQAFYDQHPDRCLLVHIDAVVKEPARFSELLQKKLHVAGGLDTEAFDQIFHANELQKTPVAPPLAATLRSLCPGSLELYEQFNRQADLGDDSIPAESGASSHLSPLASFVQGLDEPISLPVKHSLLQLLMSSVAPELTERMLVRFDHTAQDAQKRVDQLWMFAQHLQRLNDEQTQELNRNSTRIESLATELDSKSARIESLTTDLGRRSAQIDSLTAELDRSSIQIETLTAKLDRGSDRISSLTSDLERDAARIDSLMSALERDADRIESLLAELNSIHGTFVWKVVRTYHNLRGRNKKAA
jgi:O-antigen biosynthesis protein